MKISNMVISLALWIALLAFIAAGAGLFWQDGGSAYTFTSLQGAPVQINGHGVYHFDTTLSAVGFQVQDAMVLGLGIPILLVSVVLYRRGSQAGGLVLTGTLAYFLYNYASLAFGAMYNNLFLIYLALLSSSLFALILMLTAFDVQALPAHFSGRLPRRGISLFLILTGAALALIWLVLSIVPGLTSGTVPFELATYTTVVTYVIDMGIVAPCLILAGVLLLRRAPIGSLLASVMLVFSVMLNVQLLTMGVVQYVTRLISTGQFIGFVVSFALMGVFALGFTIALFRDFSRAPVPQNAYA